ncbi:hypothetical protein GCM10025782_04540 [Pedococcus ginsenosidimutans]|uniref:Phospholipase n=1 Tax=Pedococcus ginsenosidimutans TaxID=490570 RepID=A0ABP8XMU3_9MICO
MNHENPFAGQGPVLLDIGGSHGALVVSMPSSAEGLEVEVRPAGTTAAATAGHHPHVAVVARPGPGGPVHTLVYPDLVEGDYELVPLPGNEVVMTAHVTGGEVASVVWPGG